MPHLIFECSDEIKSKLPFKQIFIELHQMLSDLLPTQISSCKSRVFPYSQYLVGDDESKLFIHLTIKILPGRTTETKSKASERVLELLKQVINDLRITNISISVEVLDLSVSYLKDII